MNNYLNKLNEYSSCYIYDFKNKGSGGIGDFFKYFIKLLNLAINHKKKIYILKNDTYLEKYIKLKYDWYISEKDIINLKDYKIYQPQQLYSIRKLKVNYKNIENIKLNEIFEFTE